MRLHGHLAPDDPLHDVHDDLAQARRRLLDSALARQFNLRLGGGAIGAAVGDGLAGSQTIAAIARQPEIEAKARQYFFLTVGLVEAMYFINLLFMVVFVYVFAAKSITA